ncbi:hypothetical protein BD779DRAFT_500968 [Infundibulicybe gibba]|nr:hypothetical protein BD779DRAFT_500968 [Infundibulicybe gibba]
MGELQLRVPPLSDSMGQNGTGRASRFIQKLSNFKSKLTSRRTKERDGTNNPYSYSRQTRSMDVRVDKPFMSQPILGLNNTRNASDSLDGGDSSHSASPSHSLARPDPPQEPNGPPSNPRVPYARASMSAANLSRPAGHATQPQAPIPALPNPWSPHSPQHSDGPVTVVARTGPAVNSHTPTIVVSQPQGLPPGAQPPFVPEAQLTPPIPHTTQRPDTKRNETKSIIQTTPVITPSPPNGSRERSSAPPRPPITVNTGATPRRSPPPRLPPFLPHRFSASIVDSGSARLSPTVITRHPPLPLLHLPTLPRPSGPEDRRDTARHRMRSLKSMPALPMIGSGEGSRTGEGDGEGGDEGDGGDEEDEEDDIEEEDEENGDAAEDEGDAEVVRASMSTDQSGTTSRAESRASSYLTGIEDPDPSPSTRRSSHLRHSITSDSLPGVDTTRFSLSFIDAPSTSQEKGKQKQSERDRESEATPTATISRSTFPIHESRDYFTSQMPAMSHPPNNPAPSSPRITQNGFSSYTPRPMDVSATPRFPAAPVSDVISPRILPLAGLNKSRPSIYKHASKSLIDVRFGEKRDVHVDASHPHPGAKGKEKEASINADRAGDAAASDVAPAGPNKSDPVGTPDHDTTHPLRRQRSMPTYTAATSPPPYPSFAPHPYHPHQPPRPQPREEEGREQLPPYSNSIYLRAIMPCKKEFLASRVQARDRKWRRVLCVLEGTALKIYRCTPSDAGVGPLGGLWEKAVGVGDVSIGAPVVVQKNEDERREAERILKLAGERQSTRDGQTDVMLPPKSEPRPPEAQRSTSPYSQPHFSATRSKLNLAVQLLKPSSRPHARSHSETPAAQARAVSPAPPRTSSTLPGHRARTWPQAGARDPRVRYRRRRRILAWCLAPRHPRRRSAPRPRG